MTLRTGDLHVRAGQRERCHGAVIERGACPRCRGVTLLASCWEAGCCMVGISCFIEVGLVTTYASSRSAFVNAVNMALRACR